MYGKRLSMVILALIAALIPCSCGSKPEGKPVATRKSGPKQVYVVNYPLAYFATRIAGEALEVEFPAPADEDPAFWMPSRETVQAYQEADLVLCNGAKYAKWLDKVSLSTSKLVDTSWGFKDQYLEVRDPALHSHGSSGPHRHAGVDCHTWLDPVQAKLQAQAVCKALGKLVPEKVLSFEANLKALEADLDEVDRSFGAISKETAKAPVLASHPVYNYLARRYGWNLKSLHWEPREMPADEEWQKLTALLKEHPAKFLIWEDTPDPKIVERLKQDFGLDSVVVRPCGNRPATGDYLSEMKANIKNLTPVLSGGL